MASLLLRLLTGHGGVAEPTNWANTPARTLRADALPATHCTGIDDAVAIVRRHRAAHTVPLGMPVLAVTAHHTFFGGQCMTRTTNAQTRPMLDGRRDDSMRRRQRVLAVLHQAAATGDPIGASAIARTAGVDRTFLYRHRDLLEKIHALQADPAPDMNSDYTVTRASLRADLLAAHERAARLNTRIHQLEKRLSEALGEHSGDCHVGNSPTHPGSGYR